MLKKYENLYEQIAKKKMAKKTRIQTLFQRSRKRIRKQLNKDYPEYLPSDGGVKQFERERLTLNYFNQMFNLKYNKNEAKTKINAPKKRRQNPLL